MMDERIDSRNRDALRAYVTGDSSEPVVLSAFHRIPPEERTRILALHRHELEEINGARLLILESMLLPLEDRRS